MSNIDKGWEYLNSDDNESYYGDDGKEHAFGRYSSTFQIYIPTFFGSASISYFHYKFNIYEKSQ